MTSDELEQKAAALAEELRTAKDSEDVLRRVQASVTWTSALSQSDAGRALFNAINNAPLSDARTATKNAYHSQLREADVAERMRAWWESPPGPEGEERLELTFVDGTPGDETWAEEKVLCTASEPFKDAAQRFMVAANKKYRNPFLPSRHFDFDSFAGSVADFLAQHNEDKTVRYVRDDYGRAQREEAERSPARLLAPWDRARIFPDWCKIPDEWEEPFFPPRGLTATISPGDQYYVRVPTLHIPATGVHPATKAYEIARVLYIPVRDVGGTRTLFPLDPEHDYVPTDKRVAVKDLDQFKAGNFLGKVIQLSALPTPRAASDAPPAKKKRKTVQDEDSYANRAIGIAWKLTLDENEKPDWLHCVMPLLNWHSEFVVDLKGLGRSFSLDRSSTPSQPAPAPGGPSLLWGSGAGADTASGPALLNAPADVSFAPSIVTKNCAWIGLAVLDADVRVPDAKIDAFGRKEEGDEDSEDRLERWLVNLNAPNTDKLVEIEPCKDFEVGDPMGWVYGEWEADIRGVRAGVWRMSVSDAPSSASSENALPAVSLRWLREGTVDYDALPPAPPPDSADQDLNEDAGWEKVASFLAESGAAGLISPRPFYERVSTAEESSMEYFFDQIRKKRQVYIPGGIVVDVPEGDYVVQGRRDDIGRIVALRLRAA